MKNITFLGERNFDKPTIHFAPHSELEEQYFRELCDNSSYDYEQTKYITLLGKDDKQDWPYLFFMRNIDSLNIHISIIRRGKFGSFAIDTSLLSGTQAIDTYDFMQDFLPELIHKHIPESFQIIHESYLEWQEIDDGIKNKTLLGRSYLSRLYRLKFNQLNTLFWILTNRELL